MKTIRFDFGANLLAFSFLILAGVSAQSATLSTISNAGAIVYSVVTPVVSTTSIQQDGSAISHLDNAVLALSKGDKDITTAELKTGIAGLETEAKAKPTSFKDKLLDQASKLKALLPLIPTGALGNGVLSKAVSLAKLAAGGNQLEGILAAGSLIGKGTELTSGLSGIGSALSVLGGSTQSSGQSLVSTALSTVGKLNQGGLVAKAAEVPAKTQIGSVLNFVKGAL